MINGPLTLIELAKRACLFSDSYKQYGIEGFSTGNMSKEYSELLRHLDAFHIDQLELPEDQLKDFWEPNVLKIAQMYGNKELNIGLIFVPKGSFVDLHDHPGMVVTTKVLKGTVVRYAMDIVHRKFSPQTDIEDFAKKKKVCFHATIRPKAEFKANECFNLTPISGNIHCFLAKENSIFLDILTPYYSDERPCSFYSIIDSKLKGSCPDCLDFKRKIVRPDERDTEIIEIEVDETLPSNEFRDIDLFEKYNLQKNFLSSKPC